MEQVLDWNDTSISWEGRGGDRGLRGIAFYEDRIFLAASDEIFVYDKSFRLQGSFRNRYLRSCHEIFVYRRSLFLTSTRFDSVLEYDLETSSFLRGYCLRYSPLWRVRRRLNVRPRPAFRIFDPNGYDGPREGDTCHINNVFGQDGMLFVAGGWLGNIWAISGSRLQRWAHVPYGTHNARPFRDGVLVNHTATNRIILATRRGRIRQAATLPVYDPEALDHSGLSNDIARQSFGRGLTVLDNKRFVGGSSPATLTLYELDPLRAVASVNITMDVRNAIHGLEVWPFDRK